MKCIIIDDEPLARYEIEQQIKDLSDLEIVGVFSNAIRALEFIENNSVDLLFLDIEMPSLNGIELAKKLPKNILIIFTTAYPQHALISYELDAIDYLLKPIDERRLNKAILKAQQFYDFLSDKTEKNSVESNTETYIFIKSDRRYYKINFNEIFYIEALKDYVILYTENQKLITAMNLKTMHKKLPDSIFYRVSKSYIVNKNFITSFDHSTIYINEITIPIGNVYKNDFYNRYTDNSLQLE